MVKNVFGLYCVKLSMGNTKHLALKFAKDLNKKIITTVSGETFTVFRRLLTALVGFGWGLGGGYEEGHADMWGPPNFIIV